MSEVLRTQCNVPVEVVFELPGVDSNNFEVTLDFADPSGSQRAVPALWAGGDTWKVRYASPIEGRHTLTGASTARSEGRGHVPSGEGPVSVANRGCVTGNALAGEVHVTPYEGANPLFAHGPVQVAADRRHLAHADGTPFFWLGDTWWMGLTHRLHWPNEFKRLAEDRREKGFNVIQIVAGLYPDMPAFDPRGEGDDGFPWEADYAQIRPEYFDAADERLRHLIDCGLTPCIVGAWGYFLPWMGVERMKRHWRHLIARYASWPVVWCAAGEANLPWYLAEGFPYDDREQVHGWTEVMRFIRATDPFHRPLTIHPTAINRYTARHAIDDASLLDFDMLQTPHGQADAAKVAIQAMRESYEAEPTMPVINGEAAYEMLSDSLPTRWTRAMFWLCLLGGAAGHTYGANGIWQCNRRDEPHGDSPHGGTYGKIPWDEAMNLPGSAQMAEGKRFFEGLDWTDLEPLRDGSAFEDGTDGVVGAAVGGEVRLVYALEPKAVVLNGLKARRAYSAFFVDPAFAAFYPEPEVIPDADGRWTCAPPAGAEEDWLLVVRER